MHFLCRGAIHFDVVPDVGKLVRLSGAGVLHVRHVDIDDAVE